VTVTGSLADKGRGLTLMASLAREGGAPVYKMSAHNGTEVCFIEARPYGPWQSSAVHPVARFCSIIHKRGRR